MSLEEVSRRAKEARAIMRAYPEVDLIQSQVGRPDDGTDPTGFYNAEFSIPLRPEKQWPAVVEQTGWRRWLFGPRRPRTKPELIRDMNVALDHYLPGIDWNFSQYIRDNVMESLSGVKGDNSVKIIGPDLDELEYLAARVKGVLDYDPGRGELWHLQHQGPAQPRTGGGPGEVQVLERQRGRRPERHQGGGGRPGGHADDRGGEDL
jgi:cobalt-zinc-cadmium resistance protein CzcA